MKKREGSMIKGKGGSGVSARVRRAAETGSEAVGDLWENFLHSTGLSSADTGGHALVEPYSYEFTPSFVHHNGRCASVVQLYNRKGQNRSMSFQDVLDLIPTVSYTHLTLPTKLEV